MTYVVFALVAAIALYFLLTRREAFAVNDPDRFVASLESPDNRRTLASILDRNTLGDLLPDNFYSAENRDFLLSAGADPVKMIRSNLIEIDLLKDQQLNDRENLIEEIANDATPERIAYLRTELESVEEQLKQVIIVLIYLIPTYIKNRQLPGALAKYRALSRFDLIHALNFLLSIESTDLFNSLVLTDRVHRKKFTIRQQQEYAPLMNKLDIYWVNRASATREALKDTDISSDIANMVSNYSRYWPDAS
jgi:hypothetical protein